MFLLPGWRGGPAKREFKSQTVHQRIGQSPKRKTRMGLHAITFHPGQFCELSRGAQKVETKVDKTIPDEYGFVYILGCKEGYYKIGHSRNVLRRYSALTGTAKLPFKMWICYVFMTSDRYHTEWILHRQFAHSRLNGEWFKLNEYDLRRLEDYAWKHQSFRDWSLCA